jgi:hypothetical protein
VAAGGVEEVQRQADSRGRVASGGRSSSRRRGAVQAAAFSPAQQRPGRPDPRRGQSIRGGKKGNGKGKAQGKSSKDKGGKRDAATAVGRSGDSGKGKDSHPDGGRTRPPRSAHAISHSAAIGEAVGDSISYGAAVAASRAVSPDPSGGDVQDTITSNVANLSPEDRVDRDILVDFVCSAMGMQRMPGDAPIDTERRRDRALAFCIEGSRAASRVPPGPDRPTRVALEMLTLGKRVLAEAWTDAAARHRGSGPKNH